MHCFGDKGAFQCLPCVYARLPWRRLPSAPACSPDAISKSKLQAALRSGRTNSIAATHIPDRADASVRRTRLEELRCQFPLMTTLRTVALGLGIGGAALLFAASRLRILIRNAVSPSDADAALLPLVSVPLSEITEHGKQLKFATRSDAAWRRVTRNWGEPFYVIFAARPSPSVDVYCLADLGLGVAAQLGGNPLPLEITQTPPYGLSSSCAPVGLRFRAPSGATVTVRVFKQPGPRQARRSLNRAVGPENGDRPLPIPSARVPEPAGNLVVMPDWSWEMKDKLVGVAIDQGLHTLEKALAWTACCLILSGLLLSAVSARQSPIHRSPPPTDRQQSPPQQ